MIATRYIATGRFRRLYAERPSFELDDVAIGGYLTLFKTLRNAVECAGSAGAVWLFDLERLPRIAFERFVVGTPEYRALERARKRDEQFYRPAAERLQTVDEQIAEQLAEQNESTRAENEHADGRRADTRDRAVRATERIRAELHRQFQEAEQQMVMWSERALKLQRLLSG